MLGRTEKWILGVVAGFGLLLLVGAVVAAVRWADVKAWLDAPDVLAVNAAALAVPLPPGSTDDPTRSACGHYGALRCSWTTLAPDAAVDALAAGLRAAEVEVPPTLCDDAGLPRAARDGLVACGVRIPAADSELWLLATDRTPVGGVPLGRTAVWFVWDTLDMPWPLYERLIAADPYLLDGEPPLATPSQVEAALPGRYRGITEHCWDPAGTLAGSDECHVWEAPVDVADLGAQDAVGALVRELADHGFFVDSADPTGADVLVQGHRFTAEGGWTGVQLAVRAEADGLVARILLL